MCFHTSLATTPKDLKSIFDKPFEEEDKFERYYHANGFAHPQVPVVTKNDILLLSWGLIPPWVKDEQQAKKMANSTLNARDETIFKLPSFRGSIIQNRCIIPVTGFFEPHTYNGKKYPFLILPKNKTYLNLAGIFSYWKNPLTQKWIGTFSIITTIPNRPIKAIHNEKDRMAVILDNHNTSVWLDADLPSNGIKALMAPCDEYQIMAYSVSKDLFSPKVDSNREGILDYVEYPELSYDHELYKGFNIGEVL
jgi:putative SOS response-associated peptidase YedK